MFIVDDQRAALTWYAELFEVKVRTLEAFEFHYLQVGDAVVEFLRADEKNQPGTHGQVGYWLVEDFDGFVRRAEGMGAGLYRGPIPIEEGRRMAQIRDPFGNVFGIRGV